MALTGNLGAYEVPETLEPKPLAKLLLDRLGSVNSRVRTLHTRLHEHTDLLLGPRPEAVKGENAQAERSGVFSKIDEIDEALNQLESLFRRLDS